MEQIKTVQVSASWVCIVGMALALATISCTKPQPVYHPLSVNQQAYYIIAHCQELNTTNNADQPPDDPNNESLFNLEPEDDSNRSLQSPVAQNFVPIRPQEPPQDTSGAPSDTAAYAKVAAYTTEHSLADQTPVTLCIYEELHQHPEIAAVFKQTIDTKLAALPIKERINSYSFENRNFLHSIAFPPSNSPILLPPSHVLGDLVKSSLGRIGKTGQLIELDWALSNPQAEQVTIQIGLVQLVSWIGPLESASPLQTPTSFLSLGAGEQTNLKLAFRTPRPQNELALLVEIEGRVYSFPLSNVQ